MRTPRPTTVPKPRLKTGYVHNDIRNLRQLLLELYVSSSLSGELKLPDDEWERLHDTVLAAGEGKPFKPLGLPFPRYPVPQEPPPSTDQDA